MQSELNKVSYEWNAHFIQKSRHYTMSGLPDELYPLPQGVGYQHQVKIVTDTEISGMK